MLNALMLANGGAIVGLFTFIGNVVGKATSPVVLSPVPLWAAFCCFVVGLGLALAAHVFAFLSQQMFHYQSIAEAARYDRSLASGDVDADRSAEVARNRSGMRHYAVGIALAFIGILLFVSGAGLALFGLLPR